MILILFVHLKVVCWRTSSSVMEQFFSEFFPVLFVSCVCMHGGDMMHSTTNGGALFHYSTLVSNVLFKILFFFSDLKDTYNLF